MKRLTYGLIGVLGFAVIAGPILSSYVSVRDTECVQVTGKRVKRVEDVDVYRIDTKSDKGEILVLENTDAMLHLKFNSADVQASVVEGGRYRFKINGYRLRMLSMFPNILEVKEEC